jgi:hypothetical protein
MALLVSRLDLTPTPWAGEPMDSNHKRNGTLARRLSILSTIAIWNRALVTAITSRLGGTIVVGKSTTDNLMFSDAAFITDAGIKPTASLLLINPIAT